MRVVFGPLVEALRLVANLISGRIVIVDVNMGAYVER
jgi:hypothetical protein